MEGHGIPGADRRKKTIPLYKYNLLMYMALYSFASNITLSI